MACAAARSGGSPSVAEFMTRLNHIQRQTLSSRLSDAMALGNFDNRCRTARGSRDIGRDGNPQESGLCRRLCLWKDLAEAVQNTGRASTKNSASWNGLEDRGEGKVPGLYRLGDLQQDPGDAARQSCGVPAHASGTRSTFPPDSPISTAPRHWTMPTATTSRPQ